MAHLVRSKNLTFDTISMKSMACILATIMFLIIWGACAATKTSMTSVSDESYIGTKARHVLVSCPIEDLEVRSFVEGSFKSQFRAKGISAFRAMDLFPPLRDYTISEIADSLQSLNVEAIVVVAVTDYWKSSIEVLGKTVSTTKEVSTGTGSIKPIGLGSMLQLTTRQETTSETTSRYIPGITLTQENVRLDVRMFSVVDGFLERMIWRGNSTTVGNYFAGGSKVMKDAALKIVRDLQNKRILWSKPNMRPTQTQFSGSRVVIDAYGMPKVVQPQDSASSTEE